MKYLTGADWVWLLLKYPKYQPQLSKYDWDKLDGEDWVNLLIDRPQFSEFCDWGKLIADDWVRLLKHQPQFSLHQA